jgi:Big-like domain-containing protein
VALASGTAQCATSALASGTHSITARYSGDASYDPAASSAVSQVVNAAATDAAIALASSANPSTSGQNVTFTATVSGSAGTPTGSVDFRDGSAGIAGCATVALAAGSATCTTAALAAGSHSITVLYSGDGAYRAGSSAALAQDVTAVQPPPADPPRLGNISTRAGVLTGEDVMIAGFVVGGSTPKTVAITATGPSLAAFGVANPLADPQLTLVRSSDQAVVAGNDDWQADASSPQLQASGFAPTDAREAGLLVTLPPGAYTAIVSGAGGGTGVAVVGVFEVDHPELPLVNISTRSNVRTGEDVMIGGFVVQGSGPQTVVITATGPSLAAFGIAHPLADPTLTLVRSSDQAPIAANDDWQSAPNAADIRASGFAPADAHESAIMVTLDPGAYTAIVSGANGATGVGVVAAFRVAP